MRFWTLAFAFPLMNTGSIGFAIYFDFINTFFLNIFIGIFHIFSTRYCITRNVEENEILHEILLVLSCFPRYISCFISEILITFGTVYPLNQFAAILYSVQ